ncbi:MAG: hypothetical protein K2X82_07965 [Gemmataceae bacterium]|nr:hypothetical protein [Gemmataceae bacterium]
MTRTAVLAVVLGGVAAAAPVPPETEGQRLRRLGEVSDPRGDATFDWAGDELRVSVPARRAPVETIFLGSTGARAWREVGGDFTAVVRVSFPAELVPGRDPDRDGSVVAAAGLVAADEAGETATVVRGLCWWKGRLLEGFNFDRMTTSGEGGGRGQAGLLAGPTWAAYLRLVRDGRRVRAGFSRDGVEWTDLGEYQVGWPDRVKVGVIAGNGPKARFEVTFDRYGVTQPK